MNLIMLRNAKTISFVLWIKSWVSHVYNFFFWEKAFFLHLLFVKFVAYFSFLHLVILRCILNVGTSFASDRSIYSTEFCTNDRWELFQQITFVNYVQNIRRLLIVVNFLVCEWIHTSIFHILVPDLLSPLQSDVLVSVSL